MNAKSTRRDVLVDGMKLRDIREAMFLSQGAFAEKIGQGTRWVGEVERLGRKMVLRRIVGTVAEKLGLNPSELLVQENVANLEPYTETSLEAEVPFFDLPVAASGWVEVVNNEDGGIRVTPAQIRQGLIRVRVRGDSMEPTYPDGCIVEFRLLRTPTGECDFSRLRDGKRYYVQLADGTATFKQLVSADAEEMRLKAINPHYKKMLVAPCAEICRIAVVVGQFVPET